MNSQSVTAALLAFYQARYMGSGDEFADCLSEKDEVSVIGSAPDEVVMGRDAWLRLVLVNAGPARVRVVPSDNLHAYDFGPSGYAIDFPTLHFPGGDELTMRVTAVFTKDALATWKLVHLHASVGVPD